jgi:hypothetical protein
MSLESVTQELIDYLMRISKYVVNPNAKSRDKNSHIEYNYDVLSNCGEYSFVLFVRSNKRLYDDFFCGVKEVVI